jgi:hypothetical protein
MKVTELLLAELDRTATGTHRTLARPNPDYHRIQCRNPGASIGSD